MKNEKINIISLGCPKNLVDTEYIYSFLKKSGYNNILIDSPELPIDTVIINTCGFINDAKEESLEMILYYAEQKKQKNIKTLIVCGCLSQRYRNEIQENIPEIDAIFGVNQLSDILAFFKIKKNNAIPYERLTLTPQHYAYLKVAEGCNRKCSFCSIPLIRGKLKSEPIEFLVKQAQYLAEHGTKEIILVAQDIISYGLDLYGKKKITKLIQELSKIDKIEWIRILYGYPYGFPIDLLHEINQNPKVCKYIDLPIQHINDKILKAMKRNTSSKTIYKLIENIRKTNPNIAIRTSIIVGFPGETKKEFNELIDFVETIKFERLGVFCYSHEEQTEAAKLSDNIPNKIKKERAEILMKIQEDISLEKNSKFLNKKIKVIIDEKENDRFLGRTEWDAPEIDNEVIIQTENKLKTGDFIEVNITGYDAYELFANVT